MNDKAKPELELRPENLDAQIKRVDEDRWLSSRYASIDGRRRLMTLYAFQLECVRATQMSEAMLGHIRIQWWRDALGEIARGAAPRRHDLTLEMAQLLGFAPELASLAQDYLDLFDAHIDAGSEAEKFTPMVEAGGVLARMAGRAICDAAPVYAEELSRCGRAYEAARMKTSDAESAAQAGCAAFVELPPALAPAVAHVSLARDYLAAARLSGLKRRWRIFRAVMSGRA